MDVSADLPFMQPIPALFYPVRVVWQDNPGSGRIGINAIENLHGSIKIVRWNDAVRINEDQELSGGKLCAIVSQSGNSYIAALENLGMPIMSMENLKRAIG